MSGISAHQDEPPWQYHKYWNNAVQHSLSIIFSCSYSLASPTADSIEENSAVQCVNTMLNPVSGLIWARDSKWYHFACIMMKGYHVLLCPSRIQSSRHAMMSSHKTALYVIIINQFSSIDRPENLCVIACNGKVHVCKLVEHL